MTDNLNITDSDEWQAIPDHKPAADIPTWGIEEPPADTPPADAPPADAPPADAPPADAPPADAPPADAPPAAEPNAEAIKAQQDELKKKWLKDMGVGSEEELKKKLNPSAPETDEERRIKAEKHEASLQNWAVSKGKMSLSDINAYKAALAMPAADLVFADFASEFKEANKDRPADEPVTDDEIRDAFNEVYHTNSDDSVKKKRGEYALNARAKELLADSEAKYSSVEKEFNFLNDRALKLPEYKQFVQNTLKTAIPEKLSFTVDNEEFHVELDGKDLADIEAKFKDDNVFGRYVSATDRQGLEDSIKNEAQRQLHTKYLQEIAKVAYTAGKATGLKEGKVGAKAPFVPETPSTKVVTDNKLTESERQNIREGHGRI